MKTTTNLPEYIDELPNICGAEELIAKAMSRRAFIYLPESQVDFAQINSAFAIALHMHQPLIPAGGKNLKPSRLSFK